MKTPSSFLPSTRREFLRYGVRGVGLLAFSRVAPSFVLESVAAEAPKAEKDRTILVIVQLAGGNDGLNTVVPYADANYHRLRPTLALPQNQLLPISDGIALHGACDPLYRLLKEGKLGVVQNVGYPNPNRSHFRSTEIWETASDSEQTLATGWLGRYFDNNCHGSPEGDADPCGINVGNELPQSFGGAADHSTFSLLAGRKAGRGREEQGLLEKLTKASAPAAHHHEEANAGYLRHTLLDSLVAERRFQTLLENYRPGAEYPGSEFAGSLRNVAALIAGGVATRVYYVSLGGFDTHAGQLPTHARLLQQLSEGLAAFQRDLASKRLDGQVLTMTFSEFGRRPAENDGKGTDHGTAAPLFIMGSRVRAGLHGQTPSLAIDRKQDLTFSTDFRSVYATVLDRWLGCDSQAVLGERYPALDLV